MNMGVLKNNEQLNLRNYFLLHKERLYHFFPYVIMNIVNLLLNIIQYQYQLLLLNCIFKIYYNQIKDKIASLFQPFEYQHFFISVFLKYNHNR